MISSNLGPILHRFGRYGGLIINTDWLIDWLKGRNRQFLVYPPQRRSLINRPRLGKLGFGVTPFEFRDEPDIFKNYSLHALRRRKTSWRSLFVLIQYQSVTDRRTDRRTFVLWLYQRLHSLLCYRAGKIVGLDLWFSIVLIAVSWNIIIVVVVENGITHWSWSMNLLYVDGLG